MNQELKDIYSSLTSQASTNARTVALGLIAICWLFKAANYIFPFYIYLAISFLALFFASDILQYYTGAISYYHFYVKNRAKEAGTDEEKRKLQDRLYELEKTTYIYFHVKLFMLIASVFFIGIELAIRLHQS